MDSLCLLAVLLFCMRALRGPAQGRGIALLCVSGRPVRCLTAGAQMCAHESNSSGGNSAPILFLFLKKKGMCAFSIFTCAGRASEDILKDVAGTFVSHADSLHVCPSTHA